MPAPELSQDRPVSVWRRALVCVVAVLASATAAAAVAVLGGPRWLSVGVATFTLTAVSGPVWTAPLRRRRSRGPVGGRLGSNS